MGASVSQILPEIRILWIQAAAYLGMACIVYAYQKRLARKHVKTVTNSTDLIEPDDQ
jgi:ABC-2 type transport system permease protein